MKRKGLKYIASFLGCLLTMTSLSVLPTQAGASKIVIDSRSYAEKLDLSLWNDVEDNVVAEKGILTFPKDSTESTALITKATAKKSEYLPEIVSAAASINLADIPEGETFAMALGLADVEAELGDAGNIEIRFTNNGGLKSSVVVMDDVEEIFMANPASISGKKVNVSASINADSMLKVIINNKTVCNAKLPVSGEGKVGFLQSGNCNALVSDVNITTYAYDRPENCDIVEDFERGDINMNLLTAKMINVAYGNEHCRMIVDTVNGSKAWKFDNSGHAYFGTQHKYSNFELTFDMVYLQRETIRDEEGGVKIAQNTNFCISFGDEAADYGGGTYGYLTSADMLIFGTGSTVSSYQMKTEVSAKDKGYPFYAPDCEKNFTVRVSMIDSVVTVAMKWQEETKFTEIMQYQVSERTPTGYVHIWTTSSPANFAIDNLKIINKDQDPNLIEVEHVSSILTAPDDYDYKPLTYNYAPADKESETKVEKAFDIYLFIPIVTVVCVLSFTVALMITKKAKKESGGGINETKEL